MNTIKASNVWDDDYIAPEEKDRLRGECAKLYMELRDIDVRLQDLKYRQVRCRRICAIETRLEELEEKILKDE